jgi:hypothetical protein
VTLPLTDPFCPIPPFNCGGTDILVVSRQTRTFDATTPYGRVIVLSGGTLNLLPGTYEFCSITTSRNARIVTTGGGQTTINVAGNVRLANGSSLGPDSVTATPIVNIGGTSFRLGAGGTVQAFLSAPNALASFGRNASLQGNFCVDSVRSDKGINLGCPDVD